MIIIIILIAAVGSIIFFALTRLYPLKYNALIRKYAAEYSIDPALVAAVINRESGFRQDAKSPKGALGLMQLMPGTAAEMAREINLAELSTESVNNPRVNIRLGCAYLAKLLKRYNNDETRALAAYNAGYGNVDRWILPDKNPAKAIPFNETRGYVIGVLRDRKVYDIILRLSKFAEGNNE